MVALRSRRLESLFGASLDDLSVDNIRGLADTGAQEAFDLDFKITTYGRSDADKRDLAGDVAALANTAGGVIVIGVDEDDQARATAAPGIEVTDGEVGRIQQVVAALVSPHPVFDVLTVLSANGTADEARQVEDGVTRLVRPVHGFIVIAVPRSPNAPHAVLVNQALRYPKRNGATTRYLSEPEVATAYQDRVAGAVRQSERIAVIEQEAIERLDRDKDSWLVVSLLPDLPGALVITNPEFHDFQRTIINTPVGIFPTGTTFQRASVGRRRLLADGSMDSSASARWVSAELHTDGGGVYGLALYDLRTGRRPADNGEQDSHLLDDEVIAFYVLTGILRLAQHARDRAAVGGNAVVRARLVPAATAAVTIEIGHTRFHGFPESLSRAVPATLNHIPAAETAAALDDIAQPGPALVSAAASLINEIGQTFGIAELGQLTRDGELRRRYWSHPMQQRMTEWAEQHGVTITDSVLGQR